MKMRLACIVLFAIGCAAQDAKPLTDTQKFQLTKAQLQFLTAKDTLQSTAVCSQAQQQMQAAQGDFQKLQSEFCPGSSLMNPAIGEWACQPKPAAPAKEPPPAAKAPEPAPVKK